MDRLLDSAHVLTLLAEDSEFERRFKYTVGRMTDCIGNGDKLLFAGNGGSAAQAEHIAGEFTGKFLKDRPAMPALSLTGPSAALTATGNDYGYNQVFRRMGDAFIKEGDIVVGLTTSGNSNNLYELFSLARSYDNVLTVLMTGESITGLHSLSDVILQVPSSSTPRIQEAHICIGHLMAEIVEESLYG